MPKVFDAQSVQIDGEYVVNKSQVHRRERDAGRLSETPISLPLKSFSRFKVRHQHLCQLKTLVVQAGSKRPRRLSNSRLTACRDRELM
jgi:hypothetical protein